MALLTERIQVQALSDRLVGLPTKYFAHQFDEPYRAAWTALDALGPEPGYQRIVESMRAVFEHVKEGDKVLAKIVNAKPGQQFQVQYYADVRDDIPDISWVWPGWMPRSMVTLLAAAQGTGKTFIGLDLAYRLANVGRWPDGTPVPIPEGKTLYVDAEFAPEMLKERVDRYGIHPRRLAFLWPEEGELLNLDDASTGYRDKLINMMDAMSPELVILDSLMSLSRKGVNNVEDVRDLFMFLVQLAKAYHCGMLLLHHLRKPSGGTQMSYWEPDTADGSGSSYITQQPRAVWGASIVQTGPKPDEKNDPRQLKMLKLSPAEKPDPITYRFVDGMLQWSNAQAEPFRELSKEEMCREWLLEALGDGPQKPADLAELGNAMGFSQGVIYRARKNLEGEIENTEGKQAPNNMWRLRGHI